ncbi:MAG: NurA domain-containing protein [Chloroflexota bacterium]
MAYASKHGRRSAEHASKAAHSHVIKDTTVQAFLAQCDLPKLGTEVALSEHDIITYTPVPHNPIQHIIAVDGGYQEVPVRNEFPSATICFFQFGALIFSVQDLEYVADQPFIDPVDMAELKKIQRLKLTLPLKNITVTGQSSLTTSVRKVIYDFFCQEIDDSSLMTTLKWFLFQEYTNPLPHYTLANCPVCDTSNIPLLLHNMTPAHTFSCPHCGHVIYLTDVFRLHEAIDDELGAGGIAGYVTTLLEQLVIVHLIRLILKTKPSLLNHFLFIKDGPLAFFGQTANMHKSMRALVRFLFEHHNLFLAGLEKSGAFVDHADEITNHLANGSVLLLDNDYIYKYIIPGKADPANPYGRTTYYSNKILFKTMDAGMYVISLPTVDVCANPTIQDFHNFDVTLTNIEKLKCDMYDNALMPVALANKLVSLANHPSSRILQKFAVDAVPHP